MTKESARDALVKQGLAKDGRGKFSNAAKDWLNEQLAAGVQFSDYPKNDTTVTVKGKTKEVKAVTLGAAPTPKPFHPLGSKVYATVNGKRVVSKAIDYGMREVCSNCRVSLFYCKCPFEDKTPIANFDNRNMSVPVKIVWPS